MSTPESTWGQAQGTKRTAERSMSMSGGRWGAYWGEGGWGGRDLQTKLLGGRVAAVQDDVRLRGGSRPWQAARPDLQAVVPACAAALSSAVRTSDVGLRPTYACEVDPAPCRRPVLTSRWPWCQPAQQPLCADCQRSGGLRSMLGGHTWDPKPLSPCTTQVHPAVPGLRSGAPAEQPPA